MLTQYRFKETQKLLLNYFSKRIDIFWKKKIPKGETYSYDVHDPFEVFGDDTLGFEKFYLVGENWVNNSEKDIVIVLGCNDWKFGFIADYLQDYRVAFAGRKDVNLSFVMKLFKLKIKPKAIVIWGYTESRNLSKYLKITGYDIWRMEDGFIRSASLGASHSTPYSMVIDKTGLYFNNNNPSDLENILNNYNFSENLELLEHSKELLDYVIEYKISKYNPPIVNKSNTIKTKKRVLVIGQVDGDASLRYGNPNKWTMEDMVRLAKYENPSAEILYRPHPEVYKGYQETKFRKKKVEYFAEIVSPDEHIIELIERVDHVYTITSLTGLEALLRNKKVTVLGTPFYAGWGLTDDRSDVLRRDRKLSLLELFAGAYILYPDYLGYNKSVFKYEYIQTIIMKIKSDVLGTFLDAKNNHTNDNESKLINNVDARGVFLLKQLGTQFSVKQYREIILYFKKYEIDIIVLSFLLGFIKDQSTRVNFLSGVMDLIDKKQLIEFLNDSIPLFDDEYHSIIFAQLLSLYPNIVNESDVENFFDNCSVVKKDSIDTLNSEDSTAIVEREKILYFQLSISNKQLRYKDAIKEMTLLLLFNKDSVSLLNNLANHHMDMFKLKEAKGISLLSMMFDLYKNNRKSLGIYIESSYLLNNYKYKRLLPEIFLSIQKNPELISKYRSFLGRESKEFQWLNFVLLMNKTQTISEMTGLIEAGFYKESKELFNLLCEKGDVRADKLIIAYSDFLHAEGQTEQAIQTLIDFLMQDRSEIILRQLVRFLQFLGKFNEAEVLLDECSLMNSNMNSTLKMPILLSRGKIEEAYYQYVIENFTETVSHLLGTVFRKENDIYAQNIDNALLLSVYGPGDEIRFASIYIDLMKDERFTNLNISCDYRLYPLMKRSFDNIHFYSVARTRGFSESYPIKNYNELPSAKLSSVLDNRMYNKIVNEQFPCVYLVTDFISTYRKNYDNFSGNAYLKVNPEYVIKYSQLLEKYKKNILIGLCWRSSLTNFRRMEHYLSIEELEPLFNIPNVQFVNLQYDECSSELEWVNKRYPGRIINFEDLDQYNDFDGVAALMSCLDLVIAPATTVAELAGAIGVKTWLFSNSSEIDWRKTNNVGTDVWHKSVTIVDVADKGNKVKLVEEIHLKLKNFVEAY